MQVLPTDSEIQLLLLLLLNPATLTRTASQPAGGPAGQLGCVQTQCGQNVS